MIENDVLEVGNAMEISKETVFSWGHDEVLKNMRATPRPR